MVGFDLYLKLELILIIDASLFYLVKGLYNNFELLLILNILIF